jgi:hypothetical protein
MVIDEWYVDCDCTVCDCSAYVSVEDGEYGDDELRICDNCMMDDHETS